MAHLAVYLLGQFPSGCQDKGNGPIPSPQGRLAQAVLDHWYRKGGGFTTARFCAAKDIPTKEELEGEARRQGSATNASSILNTT